MADEMMSSPGNGRRRQMRKVREGGFTEAKRQIVLDHLAGCCNVRAAAAAAGVSAETVNYHRRRDPVFAEQCAEAIETAYEALDSAIRSGRRGGGIMLRADDRSLGEDGGYRAGAAPAEPAPQGGGAADRQWRAAAAAGHRGGAERFDPGEAGFVGEGTGEECLSTRRLDGLDACSR